MMPELTNAEYHNRKATLTAQLATARCVVAERALTIEHGGKADIKAAKADVVSLADRLDTLEIAWEREQANIAVREASERQSNHDELVEEAKELMSARNSDVADIQTLVDSLCQKVGSFIANDQAAMNAFRSLLSESDLRVVETWLEHQHVGNYIVGAMFRAGLSFRDDLEPVDAARAFEGQTLVNHDASRMNQVVARAARTAPGLLLTEEN